MEPAPIGSALPQIVMLVRARADSLRARWKAACKSLAAAVMRPFCLNAVRLGKPNVRMIATIVKVIMSS